jgi:hypothetical protein
MLPPLAPPPDREPMVSSLPSKSNTAPVASANEIGVASLIILSPLVLMNLQRLLIGLTG